MITQERVLSLFEYHEGKLWSKEKSKYVGWMNNTGYLRMAIDGHKPLVHRIIFLLHHGYMPKMIDHINGNPLDNRIENLRECTPHENQLNSKVRKDNTSGCRGVSFHKELKKWRVRCNIQGKRYVIGEYDDYELACLVAEEARDKFNKGFVRKDTL